MKLTIKRKDRKEFEQIAVRKCSAECYFFQNGGEGCNYFQEKQVNHGESCLHDLVQIKNYAEAFATGDLEFVKKDASGVTALLIMQIRRMLEQVNVEGVTVEEPILDGKGNPVWIPDSKHQPAPGEQRRLMVAMRKTDHPLIQRCIQLARSIGINLADFKLTPKSADEKRAVSGHIIAENPQTLKQVMDDRKLIEMKFEDAIRKGTEATLNDPVYKALKDSGEIIN